jgi:hypothetical protein
MKNQIPPKLKAADLLLAFLALALISGAIALGVLLVVTRK